MPFAAKVPCRGCQQPVAGGYCDQCKAKGLGKDRRPSAAKRLYGHRWRKAKKPWLARPENAWCVGYPKGYHGDRLVAAQLPDHIKAHKGDVALFWDVEANWQPMCIGCNSRKAAAEERGFGRGNP
jgi:5-methylcytosine-specific restriction enzyme A